MRQTLIWGLGYTENWVIFAKVGLGFERRSSIAVYFS